MISVAPIYEISTRWKSRFKTAGKIGAGVAGAVGAGAIAYNTMKGNPNEHYVDNQIFNNSIETNKKAIDPYIQNLYNKINQNKSETETNNPYIVKAIVKQKIDKLEDFTPDMVKWGSEEHPGKYGHTSKSISKYIKKTDKDSKNMSRLPEYREKQKTLHTIFIEREKFNKKMNNLEIKWNKTNTDLSIRTNRRAYFQKLHNQADEILSKKDDIAYYKYRKTYIDKFDTLPPNL